MKRFLRYFLILMLPILFVILVNELTRPKLQGKPFQLRGVKAMNSYQAEIDNCSWYCYSNTTSHCKVNHVKFLQPCFEYIDPFYFGIINSLNSGKDYQLMNVVFLVILIPLLMIYLVISSIDMHYKIKVIKKSL